jgi:hypothetical protein
LTFFGSDVRHSTRTRAAAHRNQIIRGDKIDLWYNPADPSQAVNDRKIPWGSGLRSRWAWSSCWGSAALVAGSVKG